MAKGSGAAGTKVAKGSKGPKGPPHIHARIAYLDQITRYLASRLSSAVQNPSRNADMKSVPDAATVQPFEPDSDATSSASAPDIFLANRGLPYLLGAHLRAVSRKGQISLSRHVKRSLCKGCNARLIPGQTATKHVENRSKGGKKPHADVEVLRCLNCRLDKRFPIGARRQPKKSERKLLESKKDGNNLHVVAFKAP